MWKGQKSHRGVVGFTRGYRWQTSSIGAYALDNDGGKRVSVRESMNIAIPDQIFKETTKCPNNLSCLQPDRHSGTPVCSVDDHDGQNILFLKSHDSTFCPYKIPFGFCQVCRCPTHYAIITKLICKQYEKRTLLNQSNA